MSLNWKLNENSKTVRQPSGFVGELKRHQLSMLHRAMSIERQDSEYAFGFFADKAGTGKTAVIISLVLADLQTGNDDRQTLIIVPQNIIKQWIDEVSKFSGDKLKVKEIVYEDIINIESYESLQPLREYNILITTQDYFESIMSSLSGNGNSIYRIVYDEIDTMDADINRFMEKKEQIKKNIDRLKKRNESLPEKQRETFNFIPSVVDKGLKNRITWFVSASVYNLIDPKEGFYFLGKQIPNSALPNLFVKCNNQFIDDNLPEIEEEEEEIYECDCIADSYNDLLSVKQIDSINSMSYDEVDLKNRKRVPNNDRDLLKMLVKEYYQEMDDAMDAITNIEKKMKTFNVKDNETDHPLVIQIMNKEKEYQFNESLANEFHNVRCKNDKCENKELCTYNQFDLLHNEIKDNTKMIVLSDVLKEIFEKNPKSKVLIFSDFQGSFKHLPGLIERLNIKYDDLCKGTSKSINDAIEKYKKSDTNILLIQSSSDACGLNLQITTDLIFLHRTNETLRDQVVGRAVRQGRTGVLRVISLYNKNEIIEDEESDQEE